MEPTTSAHPWLKDKKRYRLTNVEAQGADITAGLNGVQFRWPDGYEGAIPVAVANILQNAFYMVYPKHMPYNRDTEAPPDKIKQMRFLATELGPEVAETPQAVAKESIVAAVKPKRKVKETTKEFATRLKAENNKLLDEIDDLEGEE